MWPAVAPALSHRRNRSRLPPLWSQGAREGAGGSVMTGRTTRCCSASEVAFALAAIERRRSHNLRYSDRACRLHGGVERTTALHTR